MKSFFSYIPQIIMEYMLNNDCKQQVDVDV